MQEREQIAVISLDMNTSDKDFPAYNAKSAEDKINLIAKRIEEICKQLKEKQPHSQWIIAWREYGITDADSKFLSNKNKSYLKKTMQDLTKKYPQLTIIAGTVANKKHFNDYKSKLNEVEKYYAEHKWIYKAEVDYDEQKVLHTNQLRDLMNKEVDKKGIDIIRNTTYVFTDGRCVDRRDKVAPLLETSDIKENWWSASFKTHLKNLNESYIFQPGNKKNKSCHVLLKKAKRSPLDLGIELCREHILGTLYQEDINKNTLADIHLVLSFGGQIEIDKIKGKSYVLIDSEYIPQLIVPNKLTLDELKQFPVRLYQNNVLSSDATLRGPLLPLSLKEKDVLDIFARLKAIYTNVNKQDELAAVTQLQNEFCECAYPDNQKGDYKKSLRMLKISSAMWLLIADAKQMSMRGQPEAELLIKDLFHQLDSLQPTLYPDEVKVFELPKPGKTGGQLFAANKKEEGKSVLPDYDLKHFTYRRF